MGWSSTRKTDSHHSLQDDDTLLALTCAQCVPSSSVHLVASGRLAYDRASICCMSRASGRALAVSSRAGAVAKVGEGYAGPNAHSWPSIRQTPLVFPLMDVNGKTVLRIFYQAIAAHARIFGSKRLHRVGEMRSAISRPRSLKAPCRLDAQPS